MGLLGSRYRPIGGRNGPAIFQLIGPHHWGRSLCSFGRMATIGPEASNTATPIPAGPGPGQSRAGRVKPLRQIIKSVNDTFNPTDTFSACLGAVR
jgi:hypothetical protein